MSKEEGSRKRQRKAPVSWKNCDVAATVSATPFGARRLPEIKKLWFKAISGEERNSTLWIQSMSSDGKKTSSRHLRRRATSHASRKRHRYPEANHKAKPKAGESAKALNRRSLRKNRSVLQSEHEAWRQSPTAATEEAESPVRVNWMSTHVWHAKRFHMVDLWGWKVPMMHTNRGAGAALRLLREGKSLLQDVTWSMQPIWLEAPLSSLQSLQQCLTRIIPGLTIGNVKELVEGTTSNTTTTATGHGIMHGIDRFPTQTVGPVSWMCSRCPLPTDATVPARKQAPDSFFVYLWVHPSIRATTMGLLEKLLVDMKDEFSGPHQSINGGISCLRLRGNKMIESFQAALQSGGECDLGSLLTDTNGTAAVLESLRQGVTLSLTQEGKASTQLVVVSQCPRDPNVAMNATVCTLDIFCAPNVAKDLFLALVLKGGACPVGLAEESHFHLECHPPLPLFPRDYPDVPEAISYWKGDSSDWKVVREYWETGQGRFRPKIGSLPSVDWARVVPAAVADSALVVVRGAFGKPFIDALSSSAIIMGSDHSAPNERRKRRRVRHPRDYVLAQSLTKQELETHASTCTTLAGTMSLPALLVCHLHVLGPGTIEVGAGLHSLEPLAIHLGFSTAGVFSTTRGSFHAFGAVGASKLLDAIAAASSCRAAIVCNRFGGGKEILLRIRVANNASPSCEASLSVLL